MPLHVPRRVFWTWLPRRALRPLVLARFRRHEAFDARLDHEALAEARSWFEQLDQARLPKGVTTYARSSGPGGQHVNKTESKAVTAVSVEELQSFVPKSLHLGLRESRYYTASSDSLTFHAQSHRSRGANAEENRKKLMEELVRIYRANTPSPTSCEKKKKHEAIEHKFHASRLRQKKLSSMKKQSRKGAMS
ncbi:hypothetical protein CDD82_5614 [Ophiocordyceps australis]|uniref:Prokaryotic-type class I peptide chain release factors domain-containing protein n=1 Tax=Ophiocordyceps australis TaxID=1399860 RepID=A0A2C5Y523_9HYPO|nr:hypothetical protein CDD82_5614 [Ophiocordyceps australis]